MPRVTAGIIWMLLIFKYISSKSGFLTITNGFSHQSFLVPGQILQSNRQAPPLELCPDLCICQPFLFFLNIFKDSIYFRERGKEEERKGQKHLCVRDTLISCLFHNPNQGLGSHPRHMPQLGVESATPQFTDQHSIH